MTIFLLFVFGLAIGSFLNVVTFRYELGGTIFFTKQIGGRSRCPQCKTTLRWFELLPLISFLIQAGKCRHCSYRLSWQYPLVELITGLLTAGIPILLYQQFAVALVAATGASLLWYYLFTALWLLAAYSFVVLSIIDLRYTIIPDAINIFLGGLGIIAVILKSVYSDYFSYQGSFLGSYAALFHLSGSAWVNALLAAVVGGVLFGAIIALTRGKGMGLGDLKLVIPIGLLLGWPDTLFTIAFSFIIGAILSLILMALGKKSFKDGIPFGPFLALAVFVMMFYGERILGWYFSLL